MMRHAVSTRLSLLVYAGIALAALCSALPLTGASTVDLASLALAVLAVAAVSVAVSLPGIASADLVGRDAAVNRTRLAPRTPPRQCDPDAAGHARPRAPGRS